LDKGKTVGVLARTNKRLDAVEVHCLRHGTPCLRAEGGSILKSRAMGVFMATLGLLTRDNMLDADEVLAWAKVSEDEINGIHAKLGKKGFVGIDKTLLDKLSLSATSKSTISAILRRRADWAVLLETGGVTFVLDAVFEFLAHFAEGDNRIKNDLTIVREIFGKPMPKQGGIAEMTRRMQDVRDLMDNQGKKKESGVPTVNLLTAHGSKGLEYDYVWIIGAEDGAFPDKTASVQEERRLFFVAMTRARHHLMISASGSKPMSPFVDEAGLMRRPVTPIVD
jgi:hypothetical protein